MRTSIRRTLCATAIAGGFTVLGVAFTTAAEAADQPDTTSGISALVSGNQTGVDLTAPIRATGNQITVLGDGNRNDSGSTSGSDSGSTSGSTSGGTSGSGSSSSSGSSTDGSNGTGSGNQTDLGADAPVTGSGNQVTVLGDDNQNGSQSFSGTGSTGDSSNTTNGADATGSGNQTGVDALVPVDASGNQVTVIGDGNENSTENAGAAGGTSGSDSSTTSGENGAVAGNQTDLGALAPIDATGNQVTVIGDGNTAGSSNGTGTGTTTGSSQAGATDGTDGVGAGNQTGLAALAPIDVTGNQVTVIGDGNTAGTSNGTGAGTSGGTTGGNTTDGTDGTGSGNQTDLGAVAPIDVTGNQVTVIGDGNTADSTTGTGTGGDATGGNTTDGTDGTGSGNQTDPAVTAPVEAGGNQITVIGDGNESTTDTTGPTTGTGPGGDTTSGEEGTGSGNQTDPTIAAPVDASDNQVTIIGDDNETPGTIPNTGEATGPESDDDTDGSEGTDETVDTDGNVVSPDSGTSGAGNESDDSTPAFSDTAVNQGGPAAPVAGVLPKTGSPAGLLLGGLSGLLMLLLGLGLVAGRREVLGGRLRGQGDAQAL